MDDLARKDAFRIMRDVAAESGYGPMVSAMERVSSLGSAPDKASVAVIAAGICHGRGIVEYEDKVDLSGYDAVFSVEGGR